MEVVDIVRVTPSLAPMLSALTPRERAVLACLADGATGRDVVAKELHLSVNTVWTHLRNLMAKLGVHSGAGSSRPHPGPPERSF